MLALVASIQTIAMPSTFFVDVHITLIPTLVVHSVFIPVPARPHFSVSSGFRGLLQIPRNTHRN